jgi:hypothetical protein
MDLSQPEAFRNQIAEAQKSLVTLWNVRRVVDQKMEDLKSLIRANANFLPDAERSAELMALEMFKIPSNITEAVKLVLFIASPRNERLTPTQVKERAEQRGFDFSTYTNPMASIHTILKRMKETDPPQVDFDEATGTYKNLKFPGSEFANPAFFEKLRKRVFHRLWTDEQEKAQALLGEEIDQFLRGINDRQQTTFNF